MCAFRFPSLLPSLLSPLLPSLLLVLSWFLLAPAEAQAFTVGSDFTSACHEDITLKAYFNDLIQLPFDHIPIPSGKGWDQYTTLLEERFDLANLNPRQRVFVLSLIIGVRSPDTDGHALLDFDNTRKLHSNPNGQYDHALRGIYDDDEAGNVAAVNGTRALILERVQTAHDYLKRPESEQIITVTAFVEFYGTFPLQVWAPAYYMAQGMHALQDSFAHTIRTDDLHTVIHVMNYAEAIAGTLHEPRDGLAHSDSTDECAKDSAPLKMAASQATIDFAIAFRKQVQEGDTQAVEGVLDRWFSYQSGCNYNNNYCGSYWVTVARQHPSGPYIEEYFSCQTSLFNAAPISGNPLQNHLPECVFLLLVGAWLLRRRQTSSLPAALQHRCAGKKNLHPPSGLLLSFFFAAALLSKGCAEEPLLPLEPDCETLDFVPCDSDITGTWAVASLCDNVTFPPLPDGLDCPTASFSVEPGIVGAIELREDGTYKNDLSIRINVRLTLPMNCLAEDTDACKGLLPPFQGAECVRLNEVCQCSVSLEKDFFSFAQEGRYSAEDGSLSFEESDIPLISFCAEDRILTLHLPFPLEDGGSIDLYPLFLKHRE